MILNLEFQEGIIYTNFLRHKKNFFCVLNVFKAFELATSGVGGGGLMGNLACFNIKSSKIILYPKYNLVSITLIVFFRVTYYN